MSTRSGGAQPRAARATMSYSTSSGGGSDRPHQAPSDQSAPGVVVTRDVDFATASQNLFGHVLSDREAAHLSGALPGTTLRLSSASVDRMQLMVSHPGGTYEAWRAVRRDDTGLLMLNNMHLKVDPAQQGQGLGTRIFATQVKQAAALGITYIHTLAAREDYTPTSANGYYTWARLGYDGTIPVSLRSQLPSSLANATNLSDIMGTAEGRAWWKQQGTSRAMVFDLRAGSYSRRTLSRYLVEKGISWQSL